MTFTKAEQETDKPVTELDKSNLFGRQVCLRKPIREIKLCSSATNKNLQHRIEWGGMEENRIEWGGMGKNRMGWNGKE